MNNDLISREALRKAFHERIYYFDKSSWDEANALINNAPTIEPFERIGSICEENCGYRPQGECKTCAHRDPEDKKCDCGAIERQGCSFPVSDDYFCKYYVDFLQTGQKLRDNFRKGCGLDKGGGADD